MSKSELIANYPAPPKGFTNVPEGGWRLAEMKEGDPPLATFDIWCCVAVAVANTEAGRGYLGHFFHPSREGRPRFHGMLQAIEANENQSSELHAWIGGACYLVPMLESLRQGIDEHNEGVQADREYVRERISALDHVVSLTEEWLKDEGEIDVLTFNPNTDPAIEYVWGTPLGPQPAA